MRQFKSDRGELYLSNDTRLVQKVHLKSYLRDKENKVSKEVTQVTEYQDINLAPLLLELQNCLKFPHVRPLQSLKKRSGPSSGCPALDSTEQDVTEDTGRVQV